MMRLSALSARPNTATEVKVTGSRFLVLASMTFTSSPTKLSLPFQGFTCSLTMFWHQARRLSGSVAGISVGEPIRAPSRGVPAGAPGEVGSIPLRL